MSTDFYDATIVLSALIGMWAMYVLGRRHGLAAERRRVQYLIDVARCTVTSLRCSRASSVARAAEARCRVRGTAGAS